MLAGEEIWRQWRVTQNEMQSQQRNKLLVAYFDDSEKSRLSIDRVISYTPRAIIDERILRWNKLWTMIGVELNDNSFAVALLLVSLKPKMRTSSPLPSSTTNGALRFSVINLPASFKEVSGLTTGARLSWFWLHTHSRPSQGCTSKNSKHCKSLLKNPIRSTGHANWSKLMRMRNTGLFPAAFSNCWFIVAFATQIPIFVAKSPALVSTQIHDLSTP